MSYLSCSFTRVWPSFLKVLPSIFIKVDGIKPVDTFLLRWLAWKMKSDWIELGKTTFFLRCGHLPVVTGFFLPSFTWPDRSWSGSNRMGQAETRADTLTNTRRADNKHARPHRRLGLRPEITGFYRVCRSNQAAAAERPHVPRSTSTHSSILLFRIYRISSRFLIASGALEFSLNTFFGQGLISLRDLRPARSNKNGARRRGAAPTDRGRQGPLLICISRHRPWSHLPMIGVTTLVVPRAGSRSIRLANRVH